MAKIYLRDSDGKIIVEIGGQVFECEDTQEALETLRRYLKDLYG